MTELYKSETDLRAHSMLVKSLSFCNLKFHILTKLIPLQKLLVGGGGSLQQYGTVYNIQAVRDGKLSNRDAVQYCKLSQGHFRRGAVCNTTPVLQGFTLNIAYGQALWYTHAHESSPLFKFQLLLDEHGQSHKIVEKYAGILAENMCYIM